MKTNSDAERLHNFFRRFFNHSKLQGRDLVALVVSQSSRPKTPNTPKIDIRTATNPERQIGSYLSQGNALWYWATLLVGVATVTCVFAVPGNAIPFSYVRNVLGIVFVFLLPGFAFLKAVFPVGFPHASSENVGFIEQFGLSLGLSVALTPMVGLVLYYMPLGLGTPLVTLCVFAVTVLLATAGLVREARQMADENYA